ncbi:MAG: M48 family metalloprotease [Hydrococcus sp. Prado102]|jgi:Zn-dependent protease with chaperone function|nr:M48 family metalloprotease [Hydrococcus sp. Prado102]
MSLKDGLKALQQSNYVQAIALLEAYCQTAANPGSSEYAQAQMALARAYHGSKEKDKAIAICQQLEQHLDSQISSWAKGFLSTLNKEETQSDAIVVDEPKTRPKAGRAAQTDVRLARVGVTDNLAIAIAATVVLSIAVIIAFYLCLLFLFGSRDLVGGLISGTIVSVIVNALAFFASPSIMDYIQKSFYEIRWLTLAQIKERSPETAEVIKRVCDRKNLNWPRLGILETPTPTIFTYGSLPDNARIVISQGLLDCLDDDEIAVVYAHELGHIVHKDFAFMTAASAWMQLAYLSYTWLRNFSRKAGKDIVFKSAIAIPGFIAYTIYLVVTYLASYLSRTREVYADRFAVQTTGNPNGLARALVKIASAMLENEQNAIAGIRLLNICDPGSAVAVGTAYRQASQPQIIGRVLLWDMFNPWSWWIEMNLTHPLMGKRLRVLATYAEQLKLETEFDLAAAIQEGKKLNKNKLYANLLSDILLYNAQWVGSILGFILGFIFAIAFGNQGLLPSLTFFGFGIGMLIHGFVMYPDLNRLVAQTEILTLLCDPYIGPLRARPVQIQGEIVGCLDAGYQFTRDLVLRDRTGNLYLRYASRWGFWGNFLFGMTKAHMLIGSEVKAVGWFRRELFPRVDLAKLTAKRTSLTIFSRFWSFFVGICAIAFGFVAPKFLTFLLESGWI